MGLFGSFDLEDISFSLQDLAHGLGVNVQFGCMGKDAKEGSVRQHFLPLYCPITQTLSPLGLSTDFSLYVKKRGNALLGGGCMEIMRHRFTAFTAVSSPKRIAQHY